MCRILVSSFSKEYVELFREILDAFIKSSERDIVLEKISTRSSHGDGWGLAAIGLAEDTPAVILHKTILPIYHNLSRDIIDLFLKRLEQYDSVKILVHTRLSSRREPYGEKFTHPFEVLGSKLTIWFIHNGGVDKRKLSKEIGVNPYHYTDSWIAAMYIARYLDKCVSNENDLDNCVAGIYRDLIEYTLNGSALDTGLLILYKDYSYLYASFYVKEYNKMNSDKKEYYSMYSCITGEFTAVSSSTTRYYSTRSFELMKQGLFLVRNNGLKQIDSYEL